MIKTSELTEYDLQFKNEFEQNFKKLKQKYGYVVVDARCCYICADDFKYFEKINLGKLGDAEHVYVFYLNGNVVATTELECIIGTLKNVEICEKMNKNAKNKRKKAEQPRNPLSYSFVKHRIILGQD